MESCKLAFCEIIRLRFVETQYVYLDYFSQFSNLRSRQQAADRIKQMPNPPVQVGEIVVNRNKYT